MSNRLDAILVNELVSSPTTVNSTFYTDRLDITFKEDAFSVQVTYDNGSSVNMSLVLEFSTDGINFADVDSQSITDDTGTHIWDIADTGSQYLRVRIDVTGGSIDLQRILYSGRRRH